MKLKKYDSAHASCSQKRDIGCSWGEEKALFMGGSVKLVADSIKKMFNISLLCVCVCLHHAFMHLHTNCFFFSFLSPMSPSHFAYLTSVTLRARDNSLPPPFSHFSHVPNMHTRDWRGWRGGTLIDRRVVSQQRADKYIFYGTFKGQTDVAVIGIFIRRRMYDAGEERRERQVLHKQRDAGGNGGGGGGGGSIALSHTDVVVVYWADLWGEVGADQRMHHPQQRAVLAEVTKQSQKLIETME